MAKVSNRKFLNLYIKLKQKLSSMRMGMYHYVRLLPEERADKLCICQSLYHYLSDHPETENFINITKEMLDFLHQETIYANFLNENMADVSSQVIALPLNATVQEAISALYDYPIVPIVDGNQMLVGALIQEDIIAMFSNHTLSDEISKSLCTKRLCQYEIASTDTPAWLLWTMWYQNKDTIVVVDDGMHYQGIINKTEVFKEK